MKITDLIAKLSVVQHYEKLRKQDMMRYDFMDKLDKFCKDYDVKVLDENRTCVRRRPLPEFFSVKENADIINSTMCAETESCFTISIPESRLKALLEMEDKFFRFANKGEYNKNLFEVLMDKEREELYYRQTNDGVKKAYEHYSMLLHLAGYQRKF